MKATFAILFFAIAIASCGTAPDSSRLSSTAEPGTFDSYCAGYNEFRGPDADEIRYTIDRILFVARLDGATPANCNQATAALRREIHYPANPARGRERFVFQLGARPKQDKPGELEADPGDRFALKNLDAFRYFHFITDLYLPHGDIEDISPLASITSLRVLDIRNNKVKTLGQALQSARGLEYVDLSFNELTNASGIGGHLTLKVLDLRQNPLKEAKDFGDLLDRPGLRLLRD